MVLILGSSNFKSSMTSIKLSTGMIRYILSIETILTEQQ